MGKYICVGRKRGLNNNRRGQLSIVNLISWVILLIVSIVLTPIAKGFINTAIEGTNSSLEILLLNAILPIYWLLLIGVLVIYAIPRGNGGIQY